VLAGISYASSIPAHRFAAENIEPDEQIIEFRKT